MTKRSNGEKPLDRRMEPLEVEDSHRHDNLTEENSPQPEEPTWETEQQGSSSPYEVVESGVVKSNNSVDAARQRAAELSTAQRARLESIVQHYSSDIWRLLRRLGTPIADLDYYAQEVFIVFSRKLTAVKMGGERAFLNQIAHHVASRARRTYQRRREMPEQFDYYDTHERIDPHPLPDEILERQRMRRLLYRALDEMSEDLRTVFVFLVLEELSTEEVAETLDIPEGTVKSRLRRAREQFNEQLNQLVIPRGWR